MLKRALLVGGVVLLGVVALIAYTRGRQPAPPAVEVPITAPAAGNPEPVAGPGPADQYGQPIGGTESAPAPPPVAPVTATSVAPVAAPARPHRRAYRRTHRRRTRVVVRRRPFRRSAEIVAGSAAGGALIGGLAGGAKGAGIGALAAGAGGLVYDRLTNKKKVVVRR